MSQAPAAPLRLPLTLQFPCRPAPHEPARRHPVVIRSDWTVETGHDEELERIAAALGSSVSCIPALASVLPAFRTWWQRATRQAGPVIRSDDLGRRWWCADGQHACCPAAGFPDPCRAGAHAREARHVAATTGAARRHLVSLVSGLGPAADPPAPEVPDADPPLRSLVERGWAAGLAPESVVRTCRELGTHGCRPDLTALLGLAQAGTDPSWLGATARAAVRPRTGAGAGDPPPDPSLLEEDGTRLDHLITWLAWTATDLDAREPGARADWLATGARRADITALSEAGYLSGAAAEVAEAWGISVPGAAQVLARWVASGYRPHPAHLIGLREVGLAFPPGPPAPAAVMRLATLVGQPATDPGVRTTLAVTIARHGTLQGAAVALVRARAARPDASGKRSA